MLSIFPDSALVRFPWFLEARGELPNAGSLILYVLILSAHFVSSVTVKDSLKVWHWL